MIIYFFSFFLIFISGLVIGSFLNVLIDRIPRNEKLTGRSHCENCNKTLSWKDLIPLLSFILLRGRCRYCSTKLSYQYPLMELLTGVLFVLTYGIMNYESGIMGFLSLVYYLIIVSSLIVIFFTDLRYGIIPDKIVFPAIGLSLVWIATSHQQLAISYLLSGLGACLFFLIIFFLTKRKGMGFGDIKFALLMGLFLGFPVTIFALYIAFLTGGIIGFILILWKKKKLKQAIPFGPFLVFGTILSLFLQDPIKGIISSYF